MSKDSFQKPEFHLMKMDRIDRHSEEELNDLEQFCKDIEVEDISFEDWKKHDKSLDLFAFLRISFDESCQEGSKDLLFTRTIKTKINGKHQEERVKATVRVSWFAGVKDNSQFVFENLGDANSKAVGNLYVNVKIKKS